MTAAALAELEELDRFLTALSARQHLGDHICCAAQPDSLHGSPDDLVELGVERGASICGGWAEQIVSALEGRESEFEIRAALQQVAERLDPAAFARESEELILRSLMLGALDSEWERANDEEIAPARFAAGRRDAFVYLPFSQAIAQFESRQVLPPAAFAALEDAAKRRAFTVAGLAKQELLDTAHAELVRQLRSKQEHGVGGANLRDFQRFAKERLESAGWTPSSPSHVETIYRTNVMSAVGSGRMLEMSQPKVVAALPYWQIRGVTDARQRLTHKRAHGIVLPANHPFWRLAYPPFGWNCFLPGTLIRGAVVGGSRSWYAGKAVEFTTAKGRRLSVTANHPILTAQGFVPASALRQGMKLLGYRNEAGVAVLGPGPQGHEHQAPARVEDVFRALAQAEPVHLARAGTDDFHGEARGFHGQVEVVGSYRQLLGDLYAAGPQQIEQFPLKAAHAAGPSGGALMAAFLGIHGAAALIPGSLALAQHRGAVLLNGGPLQPLRLAAPAELDALLTQEASQGLSTDADLFRELLHRQAGTVEIDEVLQVREFEFSGHVYDLQTVNGWLAADSIVVSNCRCRVLARSLRWLEANGITIGPVPQGLPDPGFESGTRSMISVPPAALQTPKAPATQAPGRTAALPSPAASQAPPFNVSPPPLPPPPAIGADWGDAETLRALESATKKLDGEKLRGGMREAITSVFPSARSKDAVTTLQLNDEKLSKLGASGLHYANSGKIEVSSEGQREAAAFFAKVRAQIGKKKPTFATSEADAVLTLVHEELHGFSRATNRAWQLGPSSRKLEEVGTELCAQHVLEKLVPGSVSTTFAGAYHDYIDDVTGVLQRHLGVTRDQAVTILVENHARMMLAPGPPFESSLEYVRAWGAWLPVTPGQREAILREFAEYRGL